jgi:hypothetical protein
MKKRHIFKCDKNRKSFQRWSDHRIHQLTAATSLMFAISSAALGYMLAVFSDEKIPIEKIATCPFVLGIGAFLISFVCGILVIFNRLDAFRETCAVIKARDQRDQGDNSQSLEELRDENDETDLWTGRFFQTQFWSFVCGGFLFFLYTFGSNWERLKMVLDRLF